MPQERLLERIRHIEEDPDHRGLVDPNQVVESIMLHLRKILNTRQGSAPIADDYGVPDFTDLAAAYSSDKVKDLIRSIKQVIRKYEPRLSAVRVAAETRGEHQLELRFTVDGRLTMDENLSVPVTFETLVDPNGKIQVV